jgi:hypothetical protein
VIPLGRLLLLPQLDATPFMEVQLPHKLHARGPMGLEELTPYKYIIRGEGQTRE